MPSAKRTGENEKRGGQGWAHTHTHALAAGMSFETQVSVSQSVNWATQTITRRISGDSM